MNVPCITGRTFLVDVTEEVLYRETRSLVPPVLGWPILAFTLGVTAILLWNFARGETDIHALPGAVAFLAMGLAAVVARLDVKLTAAALLVGNSPFLTCMIRLIDLQRVEVVERPPSRWKWPFTRLRVYSMDEGPGVVLTQSTGERIFIRSGTAHQFAEAIRRAAPHAAVNGL